MAESDSRAALVADDLQALQVALVEHNGNCGWSVESILMHPTTIDYLGWDEFGGAPIVADDEVSEGCFRVVCEGQTEGDGDRDPSTRDFIRRLDRTEKCGWTRRLPSAVPTGGRA